VEPCLPAGPHRLSAGRSVQRFSFRGWQGFPFAQTHGGAERPARQPAQTRPRGAQPADSGGDRTPSPLGKRRLRKLGSPHTHAVQDHAHAPFRPWRMGRRMASGFRPAGRRHCRSGALGLKRICQHRPGFSPEAERHHPRHHRRPAGQHLHRSHRPLCSGTWLPRHPGTRCDRRVKSGNDARRSRAQRPDVRSCHYRHRGVDHRPRVTM
ncbi:Isochorismatase (EC 3.3.2.1), partial [Pseudomonas fluorescens]